ncbi:MAG: acyl-CoA dehydratase activase [Desulfomonilia bacterium]|jgi:predicted CoA-substrate-specific enzyme activase|uniref:2-hydroxyisocaproyl-CoA dehydratase activator n=1 Tax=anaerobic digester metagenome TaxID=1263854 RepID=A0A485LVW4_9ZZZZ|nr:acyl-CoA dehydratase activase [Pseudomonadota bacterium]HON38881.1 acyl-CoA dehydratase activase [Deltaproteobacteria bacterium]HPW69539.1 acyl-CoA dehydratase activase [Deltaproteobacteria bacterium]
MIVAGCDVGSLTSKAVILNDKTMLSHAVVRSSFRPGDSARAVMDQALDVAGLKMDEVRYCVGTGYGREKIPFVNKVYSEIACHARGARHLMPSVRTVIDIGGQDCKAIRLDDSGAVVKFVTNDKCAAGTGRFLDVMARLLGVNLDELGSLSAQAQAPLSLASTCTVWAQAEVIHHLNENTPIADIAAAVNQAMAGRVAILARSVGIDREVCMTGGVAKNTGVLTYLEKLLDVKIRRLRIDPQIVGALGAAFYAWREYRRCAG